MQIIIWALALLPAIALVGPVMIGWYFGADWVLKVGLGFDLVAVGLGVGCLVLFPRAVADGAPATALSTQLLTFLGGGLVVFGVVFGAATSWLLMREDGRDGAEPAVHRRS